MATSPSRHPRKSISNGAAAKARCRSRLTPARQEPFCAAMPTGRVEFIDKQYILDEKQYGIY
jgi:hypothetical protein